MNKELEAWAMRAGCNAALYRSTCEWPKCQEPMETCPAQRETRAMAAALKIADQGNVKA